MQGMLCSRGQLLLMLDSDGATKFSDLEKLEYQMRRSMIEQMASVVDTPMAVWGSRAHLEKQALATRKWYRNLLMKGFHLFVRMVAGGGIRDTQV
jgi:dolichyl-phosphate beta-glucosyltransferase